MGFILGVYRQFEVEASEDMNVRKNAGFVVLDDLLAFDVELISFLFEKVADEADTVAENMNVDVGAFANMPRHDAANEPGPEGPQKPHEAQGFEPHVAEMLGTLFAFVNAGEDLNLIADLCVGGKVLRLDALANQTFRGFTFSGAVFGFDA